VRKVAGVSRVWVGAPNFLGLQEGARAGGGIADHRDAADVPGGEAAGGGEGHECRSKRPPPDGGAPTDQGGDRGGEAGEEGGRA